MVLTESDVHPPTVRIGATVAEAAEAAAERAAAGILAALAARGSARVLFASAPSQEAMLARLGADSRIDWSLVHSFHLDEYVGLPASAPQSFGQWLQDRLPAAALPGFVRMHAEDEAGVIAEIERYSTLIGEAPVDVTCLGIGVNGHIAFNEPGVSDLDDRDRARQVDLDLASRQQQVDEGLFPTLADVPTSAITLTVPAVTGARMLVCTVLGSHKAQAVAGALEGPIGADCPGSLMQAHPEAYWFLDEAAAGQLRRQHPGR
ncbi:MAG TPA: 6-phosphogluconolactonase [Candidatus Ruania gallistercoris]|uniref:6-phosphogluconolactonase n=1 Tax=Candidatus Ruania gallistercoris TaxID=2838746 RepID=A0A9D2EEE6_9MICO|nr:6-phosphogluconolactonase [Candidatus Ruania gallistercoris]